MEVSSRNKRDHGPPEIPAQQSPLSYTKLLSRYEELQRQHARCQGELRQALQKLTIYRERAKAWYLYAQRKKTQGSLANRPAGGTSDLGQGECPSRLDARSSSHALPAMVDPRLRQTRHLSQQTGEARLAARGDVGMASSQSTIVEADDAVQSSTKLVCIKAEPGSDDEPVIVSERNLKRKRGGSPLRDDTMRRVKQEPVESEGLSDVMKDSESGVRGQQLRTMKTMTSDLEVDGPTVQTPRKPSRNLISHTDRASFSDGKASNRPKGRHSASTVNVAPHVTDEPLALRQISTNIPPKRKAARSSPPMHRASAVDKLAMLSEDGELGHEYPRLEEPRAKGNDRKLKVMLQQPLAERSPALDKRSTKIARNTDEHPLPTRMEEEPLRIRDPKTLQLTDFKVNADYMGSCFAFADTLRGRDQRQGLHTCTRPDCCGDAFRKVIELGGKAASGKTDAQALEIYLGRDWSDVMGSFAPDTRKEMTMNAHVYALTEENGKHKLAFERRSTPPGFWRTDMPTSQEALEDRAKIKATEDKAVMERWLDATRRGGRWRFRDE